MMIRTGNHADKHTFQCDRCGAEVHLAADSSLNALPNKGHVCPGDHPGGSLNTTPSFFAATRVPVKPAIESLDDDTPLQGGFCDPNDKTCEACQ